MFCVFDVGEQAKLNAGSLMWESFSLWHFPPSDCDDDSVGLAERRRSETVPDDFSAKQVGSDYL